MSHSHYQTPESKKEEFRRYLEKSGAIDSLTSVLVGLYEEPDRPLESTEYIKKFLGASANPSSSGGSAVAALSASHQQETEKLRKENEELKATVKELNKTLETLRVNLKHARADAKKANDALKASASGGGGSSASP